MTGTQPPRGTSTSRFGVGRRESHDAGDFYARFRAPDVSRDDHIHGPLELPDPLRCGDSRQMDLPDSSVALVVTSPPYYAGKEYEAALGEDGVPGTYVEFLQMLQEVFSECRRVLEPGGRLAVNVANLGRKPYRSLSADVIRILQDDLGLLLRGEIIWIKAEGASGNCAWGSFRSPANPVLRDLTERVVVAAKGRFDRARSADRRRTEALPHQVTLTSDEFMEATLDVWRIPPESARRVGHPAPFPVELPQRLIELYTYAGDLVLDPFLGSGSTAVAAVRTGRRYVGYDTDPAYVAVASARVQAELASRNGDASPQILAQSVGAIAAGVVAEAGFRVVARNRRLRGLDLIVDLVATDGAGVEWFFDVSGAFTVVNGGLGRSETLWKSLGRASVLAASGFAPVVLLTSDLPGPNSPGERALRAVGPGGLFDAVDLRSQSGQARLRAYSRGGCHDRPLLGFWTADDLR